jgi:hypothetical protein
MKHAMCGALVAAAAIGLAGTAGAAPVTYFVEDAYSDGDAVRVALTIDEAAAGDVTDVQHAEDGVDIQATSFVIASTAADLTLVDFLPESVAAQSLFAVRLTSTGPPVSDREGSSTMGCVAEDEAACGEDADDPGDSGVPEPTTLALLGAGLLGAGLARRRK